MNLSTSGRAAAFTDNKPNKTVANKTPTLMDETT